MALPKSFGKGDSQLPSRNVPQNRPLPDYGDAPTSSLPSFDAIQEEDPFTPISPSDPNFYDDESLRGGIETPSLDEIPRIYENREEIPTSSSYEDSEFPDYQTGRKSASEIHSQQQNTASESRLREYNEGSQSDFIDEENEKLLPVGKDSKRSIKSKSKKIKVSDYDDRKNLRNRNKTAVIVVILGVLLVVAFAVYKVFLSKDNLSQEDVAAIANQQVGNTGFPLESGAAIAESFMEAYLTTNDDRGVAEAVLAHYYGVKDKASNISTNRLLQGNRYKQTIISGPIVFKKEALTPYSAAFTVGALVTAELPTPTTEGGASTANESSNNDVLPKAEWLYFNVNVYYDSALNSFSIPQDSPTVVPSPTLLPMSAASLDPGTGVKNEAVTEEVKPLIVQFFEKYRISSSENFSQLTTLVVDPMPDELKNGLNGQYELDAEKIVPVAYETNTDPNDPLAYLKVRVSVPWVYTAISDDSTEEKITLVSNYIVTLKKTSDGYLVSKMAPAYFVRVEEEG